MISQALFIEGLADAELDKDVVRNIAAQVINRASDRARTRSADEIRHQVAFPGGYLEGPKSRLTVTQRATADRLEGVISGRQRPTSLARFVRNGSVGSRGGVRITIRPGTSTMVHRAFLLPLRSGQEELGNLGLAIRVPRGTSPGNAFRPTKIADGLFLLYGPSVDQVFKTVREDVAPDAARFLESEFVRRLEL